MTIGENIRLYRKRKKITQMELGQMVGLTNDHICRIENDKVNTTLNTLTKIASALGVGLKDLIKGV